jgi:RNA polymerase sigma-70 factor, ECF subfamily
MGAAVAFAGARRPGIWGSDPLRVFSATNTLVHPVPPCVAFAICRHRHAPLWHMHDSLGHLGNVAVKPFFAVLGCLAATRCGRLVLASSSISSEVAVAGSVPSESTRDRRIEVPPQDDDLVSRIRRGDDDAFDTLFRQHFKELCAFVNGFVRAPDDAEEVVQTVLCRVWSARAQWQPRGGVRAYLFTACRNQALNVLQHQAIVSSGAREMLDHSLPSEAPIPVLVELDAQESGARLKAAIAELPQRRRLVVILRVQYQLSNAEIAQVLGISLKGVKMHYTRALQDLRRRLQPERAIGLM